MMRVKTRARALIVFACFLFVISIFFPFLQVIWRGVTIPEVHPGPGNLWSFRGTMEYRFNEWGSGTRREFWFFEYWSQQPQIWYTESGMLEDWVVPILILIFISQVFVTAFSILAVLAKNKLLLCSTIGFNAFILLCMLFVTSALDFCFDKSLSIGFWLSSTSLAMFAGAALLSRKDN